jgi:hypothetical protein
MDNYLTIIKQDIVKLTAVDLMHTGLISNATKTVFRKLFSCIYTQGRHQDKVSDYIAKIFIILKKSVEHNPAKNIQHKLDRQMVVMKCV